MGWKKKDRRESEEEGRMTGKKREQGETYNPFQLIAKENRNQQTANPILHTTIVQSESPHCEHALAIVVVIMV